MDYGGRGYWDELTERCAECGWLAEGAYPDGTPYLACRWCGYILHDAPTANPCADFRTPQQVAAYREEMSKPKRKTRKK